MQLFPPMERPDTEPARYSEPHYQYLQRTGRPESSVVRDMLEGWFGKYPDNGKPELLARLQSNDDRAFDSAFFELYLHALLLALGFDVEVHPANPDPESRRPPDFLCTTGNQRFFLEATVVRELSDEQAAAEARINTVYDTLDALDSPNFFIGITYVGSPNTPPPGRKLREFLRRELSGLDPGDYEHWSEQGGFDALPSWGFEHDGWQLRFVAIPKSPERRGKEGSRPLGMFMPMEASWRNDRGRLLGGLIEKAAAYGRLDAPYVIALNNQLTFADRIDTMEALFGQESYVFSAFERPSEPEMQRLPNGLWTSADGPRYTRVSGVMIAEHVHPWSVGSSMMRYYPNPWAAAGLGDALSTLPHATIRGQKYDWQDGTPPGKLLGVEPLR